jgi:hypothetical protein
METRENQMHIGLKKSFSLKSEAFSFKREIEAQGFSARVQKVTQQIVHGNKHGTQGVTKNVSFRVEITK